ncbi:hypothetical protein GV829_04575 [Sphingomonas lacunae]|uniref:Uncharacterized protein n=1 Tax=Sphingomonas lacunae TaxID=2698828 RepID=A0A6M4ATQ7_9SPHN|nr:toprim domain-containing protein [Sphingomonas lacunae]QJQ31810.1 hypothetical protein GV829_04575 [Sphingomonas lacunae]
MSIPMAVSEIEAMLKDRVEQLARELLPGGRKDGKEWCVGSIHGEKGQSLRVSLRGSKQGWWRDFAAGEGGDCLKLIAAVLFRGDLGKAVQWAKSWLGIDHVDAPSIERFRIEAAAFREAKAAEAEKERRNRAASARSRWQQAVPIPGTLAETYLLNRAIDLRRLGRAPGSLRFHPRLMYGYQGPEAPAMVACCTLLSGEHVATHRTWLKRDGSGKAGADEIGCDAEGRPNDPKKVMGLYAGAHIPLWKGTHRAPLRDVPKGTDIYASEGIEDGLTAACADPSQRVICFISLSNLGELELPPQMGRLIILAQNDPKGSPADKQLNRAIAAHRAKGRTVLIAPPPPGFKDLNDLVRGIRSDEARGGKAA